MDIRTNSIDILKLGTGDAVQTWHISDEIPKEKELISQSSAYCFLDDKFAIIKNKDGYWAIPGGHLEKGENPKDTVIREVLEEACVVIKNPELLGYQVIVKADKSKIYQLRWFTKVEQVLDFKPEFESAEMKFVSPDEVGRYISWWNKSNGGRAELQEAIKKLNLTK